MNARASKLPLILLGLMTILTVAGPLAIFLVMRGGESRRWPPDRPVEWVAFLTITVIFVALMLSCLTIGLMNWRRTVASSSPSAEQDEPRDA